MGINNDKNKFIKKKTTDNSSYSFCNKIKMNKITLIYIKHSYDHDFLYFFYY